MSVAGVMLGVPLTAAIFAAGVGFTPVSSTLRDAQAPIAAQQLGAIATYARWPDARRTLRVCITGQTPLSNVVTTQTLPDGRVLAPVRMGPAQTTAANCEIAIIGALPSAERNQIIRAAGATDLLTITDSDPECEYGAMFCWRPQGASVTFDLNIAAVTRSRVHVDPRVLAMGRRSGAQK